MRRTIGWAVLAGGLAAGALMAAGGAVQAQGEVNLYSSRHYNTDEKLYSNFTARTSIKINRIEDDADKLIQRMKAEGANSPADVFISVDAGRIQRAAYDGLLQPIKSPALEAAVPAHLRDPEGQWFGFSKRGRVIVYSKERVKPAELSTYEALADSKWKGRIAIRSSTYIYNQSLVGSILAALGPEKTEAWAKAFTANFARAPKGGDRDQIAAVAAGEADIAISNTYYLAHMLNSKKPEEKAAAEKVAVFFPNQNDRGAHVNVSGGGVARHAKNKENAIRFLEYLVSPQAQAYFAEGNYEYPVVEGAKVSPAIAAWGAFKEDQLNARIYAKNNAEALRIMDRAGWN
ncbi:MAG: Fe(3+) ABC transporter substrate-binding protein [Rhodospirillales bacterium]